MKSIDHRSRWKDGREALTILASPQYTSQREIPGLATGISNALRSFIKHGFATKLRWMTGTYNRVYICLKRAAVGSKRSVYVAGDMLIGDDLSEEIVEGIRLNPRS